MNLNELMSLTDDHYNIILNSENTQEVLLTDQQIADYSSNFFGLLCELGISSELHYPLLQLNGLRSSDEKYNKTFVIIPDLSMLKKLIRNNK